MDMDDILPDKMFESGSLSKDEYVVEYQIESERGFLMLGSRMFTEDALLPFDPAHFTSLDGEPLGNHLTDYEVPDDTWVWVWSRWFVDMTADVDDHGWCYSWRFRSRHWRGHHRFMRSFTRQRMWKRPRIKRTALARLLAEQNCEAVTMDESEYESATESTDTNKHHHNIDPNCINSSTEHEDKPEDLNQLITRAIKTSRNDREKIDAIMQFIERNPEKFDSFAESKDFIMSTLMFPISRNTLEKKVNAMFPDCAF